MLCAGWPSQKISTTLYYYLAVVRAVEVFDFSTELQKYWTILVVVVLDCGTGMWREL